MSVTPRPQLAHLTAAMDDLRARGTHFNLRVLDDSQGPVCHDDGRKIIDTIVPVTLHTGLLKSAA